MLRSKSIAVALCSSLNTGVIRYLSRVGLLLSALPLVVDKLDAVPEAMRTEYVEKDGKFHLDVTGMEDTSGLKSALDKERKAAKDAEKARKDLEARFAGIDPEKFRNLMDKLAGDEEAALIAAGKIEEVIGKRTEKLRGELQRQVDEAANKVKLADERANKFSQRVLDNHIRAAAVKTGLHSHAVEDALLRGRAMFVLNEVGDAVQLGEDGKPVFGKDGKTPYSPAEWLEGMKEQAPHWFPAGGAGSGAQGGSGGAGSAKTITRAAFDALSAAEKAKTVKTHKITD